MEAEWIAAIGRFRGRTRAAPEPLVIYRDRGRTDSTLCIIVYREACRLGCEGIVSKRLGSPYRSGRSAHWVKVKNPKAPAVHIEHPNPTHHGVVFLQVRSVGGRIVNSDGGPPEQAKPVCYFKPGGA
jgi:hypothetical protein